MNVLMGFDIKIDANLAIAWVDYEFWFNGNFSHCGVNSFHLVKIGDKWEIIYLIRFKEEKPVVNLVKISNLKY